MRSIYRTIEALSNMISAQPLVNASKSLYRKLRLRLFLFLLAKIYTKVIGRNEKIWVFSDFYTGQRFSQNRRYLFQHLAKKNSSNFRPIWLTSSPELYRRLSSEGYEIYMVGSLKAYYYSLRAQYVPIDAGPGPIPWWCTGGATVIQMGHGILLKADNHSSVDDTLSRAVGWKSADYAVFSSEHCKKHFQEYIKSGSKAGFINVGLTEGTSIYTGYPKTDAIVDDSIRAIDGIDLNSEELGTKQSDIVIGYFPTRREGNGLALTEIFDKDQLEEFLQQYNAKLLIKPHRQLDTEEDLMQSSFIEHIPPDTDSHQFLPEIDILITDYSAIYFDFLPLDRPVIFYTPDYDTYENVRGVHPNYEDVTAGPQVSEFNHLLTCLKSAIESPPRFATQRKNVQDQFFEYADGNASKRIVQAVSE